MACSTAFLALHRAAAVLIAISAVPAQAQQLEISLPNPDGRDPLFDTSNQGRQVEIEFSSLNNGEQLTLNDSSGSLRLINFWATWCVPCIKELPSLAALAQHNADEAFMIIPLSLDQKGADRVPEFLSDLGIDGLDWYVDPTARSGQAAEVFALPTSIVVDRDGREIGRVFGSADWASPEAASLIDTLLNSPNLRLSE